MKLAFKKIPVTNYQQNACVIWCKDTFEAVITDPGGDEEILESYFLKNNLKLKYILLTHGHLDHIASANILSKKYSAPILGPHINDQFYFVAIPEQIERFGFSYVETFYPTKWLNENDQIKFGNCKLDVLHTPGHTPGHIVFLFANKIAWVGDVLFYMSIGRHDFIKSSKEDLLSSIKTKLFTQDENMLVVPGHGQNTQIGFEKKHNPFFN